MQLQAEINWAAGLQYSWCDNSSDLRNLMAARARSGLPPLITGHNKLHVDA